jgi:prevent-host-death family protein
MNRRVDAHVARTQFGQLMDRAVRDKERFVVERRGEPTVVIMGVEDFLENASGAPDWLKEAWADSKAAGTGKMTMDEINEEIATFRREKRAVGR